MAESIIIHFGVKNVQLIVMALGQMFSARGGDTWAFPHSEYFVLVRQYEAYAGEYDPEERAEVEGKLGEIPAISYEFEIRRSKSDEACDVIESFVRRELTGFDLVVDDMFRLWSVAEIAEADDFMDVYRYKKRYAVKP